MNDLESICDDPKCNCSNVEPNFRSWYHTADKLVQNSLDIRNIVLEEMPKHYKKEAFTFDKVLVANLIERIEMQIESECPSVDFIEERKGLQFQTSFDQEVTLRYRRLIYAMKAIAELKKQLNLEDV